MIIRQAKQNDIDSMMEIFDEARGTMAGLGIDQWQDGYPRRLLIEDDVRLGRSYVCEIDGAVCATFVLQLGGDKNYDAVAEGEWLSGNGFQHYLAIHRVAIAVACRGRGIAAEIMEFSREAAHKNTLSSLRIDTHEGNVVMRKMLSKNGFSYCGVIYLETGEKRVIYEKII